MNNLQNLEALLELLEPKLIKVLKNSKQDLEDTQDGDLHPMKNFNLVDNYYGFYFEGFIIYLGDFEQLIIQPNKTNRVLGQIQDLFEIGFDYDIKNLNAFTNKILKSIWKKFI